MTRTNITAVPNEIECTEQEVRKILTSCQAAIFRDIWRLTDADAALKMFFVMERALPDDIDRSNTPNLNTLASWLREAPDVMRYLEFSINKPSIAFAVLKFQEEHNRRAAEIRAAKAAQEARQGSEGEEDHE